jgi:hypothetical protein
VKLKKPIQVTGNEEPERARQQRLGFSLPEDLYAHGTGADIAATEIDTIVTTAAFGPTYEMDLSVYALGYFTHPVF